MEKLGVLPWQWLVAWVALMGKPSGTGERPICLLPLPYRIWTATRGAVGNRWCEARAGFWDKAVKGSKGALQGVGRQGLIKP